jgi:hypothetical protein
MAKTGSCEEEVVIRICSLRDEVLDEDDEGGIKSSRRPDGSSSDRHVWIFLIFRLLGTSPSSAALMLTLGAWSLGFWVLYELTRPGSTSSVQ